MFTKLLRRNTEVKRLDVDYPAVPHLPNGANGIIEHSPVSSAAIQVTSKQFGLFPMIAYEPYEGFVAKNPDYTFADALWLDAFIKMLAPNGIRSDSTEKAFLGDFRGQIFFLATTFDTDAGPAYAFLNLSWAFPAGRYLCPVGNPVRPDIPVCAAVYQV